MIPPFHSAVDQAITYLDPVRGLVGVTDFYVSAKFDLPLRQMSWARRFFWRCAGCTTAAAAAMPRSLDHNGLVLACTPSVPYVPVACDRFPPRSWRSFCHHPGLPGDIAALTPAACCRSIFDMDGIDLGPERRQYLDHQLSRVWECNGQGSIPYVPHLRAPYYVWIGHVPQLATVLSENKVSAARRSLNALGRRLVCCRP